MQNVAHRIGKLYFIRIILCIEEENKRKYAFIRLVIRMKLGLVETAYISNDDFYKDTYILFSIVRQLISCGYMYLNKSFIIS